MESTRLQPYFLLVLLVAAGTLVFFIFKPFLAPLILASVFSVLFRPVYLFLEKSFKGKASLAAFATLLICVACILIPLSLIGSQIVIEAKQLYASMSSESGRAQLHSFVDSSTVLISKVFPGTPDLSTYIISEIDTYSSQAVSFLVNHLGSIFSSITSLLISFFIFLVALYYLLRDGVHLKRTLIELSPFNNTDDERVFDRLEKVVGSVIKGNLAIACLQGVLTAIGFTLFGVPNSILWGTTAAIAALIPGLGTALVIAPAIIFLFVTGHTGSAAGLLVWGICAVGLIDNFLGPKLLGKSTGLHPLLMLLSVLGGLAFFGPIGIFLGPLSLALLFAFLAIYSNLARVI